jgi:hypothetical protein
MKQLEDFVAWYHKLRQQGKDLYGNNRLDLSWHSRYSRFNCICWAWHNSKHLTIDGIYK